MCVFDVPCLYPLVALFRRLFGASKVVDKTKEAYRLLSDSSRGQNCLGWGAFYDDGW